MQLFSVTTNHIAKAAGISSGNLYCHYKNKEQIIREIYQEISETFVSLLNTRFPVFILIKIESEENRHYIVIMSKNIYGFIIYEIYFRKNFRQCSCLYN
ncbi:MAG: TetR/AcrR family transcriptional regulator [Sulfurimonas sp.]|nr:TetR/AcrR family transcriptional regulator [Sulfurimonas sp.]